MKHVLLGIGALEFLGSCAATAMHDSDAIRIGLLIMAQGAIAAGFVLDAAEKRP